MAGVEPSWNVQTGLQPLRNEAWDLADSAVLGPDDQRIKEPQWLQLLAAVLMGAISFHLAWIFPVLNALALVYAGALIYLTESGSRARSFRLGFLAGFLVFAPQLAWFSTIFGLAAVCLWAVLSFSTGLFVLLLRCWRRGFGSKMLWLVAPVFWCGIEFFRSELYVLKFSWLSVGYLFAERPGLIPAGFLGVYGTGFAVFLGAALLNRARIRAKFLVFVTVLLVANLPAVEITENGERAVKVAGIQLEFPVELEIPSHLDRVRQKHPDTQIFVLSEYAFTGPIPKAVKDWCRRNESYLVAGGKEDAPEHGGGSFRNTAFVISPEGDVIFRQVKSVPIQFFDDGLPATEQRVWESPWGKIAIPICYDLSYRNVTDRFVAAGAEAFIVPFMDVIDWGRWQHEQHARIAPLRAREFGLSMFRVGSSGISQDVNNRGEVLSKAEFPGQEQVIAGTLRFAKARLPLDHWLAPGCVVAALILMAAMFTRGVCGNATICAALRSF